MTPWLGNARVRYILRWIDRFLRKSTWQAYIDHCRSQKKKETSESMLTMWRTDLPWRHQKCPSLIWNSVHASASTSEFKFHLNGMEYCFHLTTNNGVPVSSAGDRSIFLCLTCHAKTRGSSARNIKSTSGENIRCISAVIFLLMSKLGHRSCFWTCAMPVLPSGTSPPSLCSTPCRSSSWWSHIKRYTNGK